MTRFTNIKISDWRQFDSIDIDLDSKVTIISGKNGSGKTTIISVLAEHFGWRNRFVSSPQLVKNGGKNIWSDIDRTTGDSLDITQKKKVTIGSISYDNDEVCELNTFDQVSTIYNLDYKNHQSVKGIHIPSHGRRASHNSIPNIPTKPKSSTEHYRSFRHVTMENHYGTIHNVQTNPGLIIKESLLSLAIFGYGNTAVQPNEEYRALFEGFQNILKKVLPAELGFEKLEIRMPEVVLVTKSGTFLMDALSGGLHAIFTIAWQIFMFGADKESATILIDEPENHLHPSMQRELIPKLSDAFPNFKFVVSTHSPIVISSTPNSKVYELAHTEQGKVTSTALDNQTLRRFLMNQMLNRGLL